MKYCLDSNVFIESSKNYYSFDIAQPFWDALVTWGEDNVVCSIPQVYDDLVKYDDDLAKWARNEGRTLFVDIDENTYQNYTEIADLVEKLFQPHQVEAFLGCSDPWVIAYAKANGLSVVTLEVLREEVTNRATGKIGIKKIPIPNICRKVGVAYINTFTLLHDQGFKFN